MTQYCPSCTNSIVSPVGNSDNLLIVLDAPTKEDFQQGRLLSTNPNYTTAGKVMRKELERVGASLSDFRVVSLWLHAPTKDENCFRAGYDNVLDNAKGKKAILLVGSDTVSTFTGYKVSDVSGLQVESSVLSAPIIYASVSPGLALSRSLGEVRFAIEKFVNRLEKDGLL